MSAVAPTDLAGLIACLDNADSPIQEKIDAISKIKDTIEPVAVSRVTQILETGLPSILKLLLETPPSFIHDDTFKLRSAIVQLLQRFPLTDVLTPHVGAILSAIMQVAYCDCEENGVACMRLLFDLHKAYKEAAAAHTADFFDFVVRCYSNMPKIAHALLSAEVPSSPAVAAADGAAAAPASDIPDAEQMAAIVKGDRKLPCSTSFQVVAELPLVVIVLLQLHPRSLKVQVARMVPQMMQMLQLQAQQGTQRDSPLHKRQEELVVSQVKTVSFMTYLLRSFTSVLEPHKEVVGTAILRLLRNCPPAPEGLPLRREVLVACRHMLASEFKEVFTPHVDVMLNETLLLGHNLEGLPSKALRPLAISTLADLLHGVRRNLSLAQLGKVVSLFARNIHDASLPTAIQCTSVRLLLNLVDSIYHNKDADGEIGRALLSRILSALVQKFGALQHYIPQVVLAARRAMLSRLALRRARAEQLAHTVLLGAVSRGDVSSEDAPALQAAAKARVRAALPEDVGASQPLPGMSSAADGFTETGDGATAEDRDALSRLNGYDPLLSSITSSITSSNRTHRAFVDIMACVKDVKTLMKTMSLGLKTLVWCVSNYRRGPTPGSSAPDADPHKLVKPGGGGALTESELDLISKFVKWGLRCFMIFTHLPPHVNWQGVSMLGLEQQAAQAPKPSGEGYGSKRASNNSSSSQSMLMLGTPEQVEMTNFFASVFTILDAHNFRDLMNKHLPLLFRYIIAYPPLQTIVQHLLANERAARPFADLVLQYLVRHIHLLNPEGPADVTRSVYVAAAAADRAAKQHSLGNSTDPPTATTAGFAPVSPAQPAASMYGESAVAFGAREPSGSGVAKPSITVGAAGEDAAYTRGYQYSREGITGSSLEASPLPSGPATSRIAPAHFVMSLTDPLAPAITASVPLVMFSPAVRSSVLVRLFRITVASITHLFTKHEPILRPYIATIVLGVLRDMLHTNNPANHLQLLKALFKSVSSGDSSGSAPLEHLYKEFPPLLPVLVHHLMALHSSTNDASVRDTAVDLCLSVPTRLSSQLTHLSRFVRPLMLGLRSRDHHVQDVALKSLEFWIDNLNPDYLYPILTENNPLGEFIASLTALLRPSPSKFGDLALRILGKLGGNNRLFLLHPPTMPFLALPETGVTASVQWSAPPVEDEDPLDAPLVEEASEAAATSQRALAILREKGALGAAASEAAVVQLPDLQVRLPLDMLSALAFRLLNRHFVPRGAAPEPSDASDDSHRGDLWQRDSAESPRDTVLAEMCKVMTDSWSDGDEEDKWITAGLPLHSKLAEAAPAAASSRSQATKEAMEQSEDIPCVPVPQLASGDARSSAVHAKQQAWRLLRLLLGQLLTNAVPQSAGADATQSSLMGLATSATEAAVAILSGSSSSASPVPGETPAQPSSGISADGVIMQSATVRRMLLALALAAGDSHLQGDACALLQGAVRHLTLLAVEKHAREASLTGSKASERLPYVVSSLPAHEGATVQPGTSFNPLVLTDVIVTLCCGSAQEPLLPVATDMLAVVLSTLRQLQGLAKASHVGQTHPAAAAGIGLFLIDDLVEQISHAAFVRSHRTQQGAATLVLALSRLLPRMVLAKRMPALVRAVIHVTKHVARVQAATTLFAARAALDSMWRAVYLPCAHIDWTALKDGAPEGTVLLKIPLVLPGVKAHAQALRSMRCQLLPRVSSAAHTAETPRAPQDMPGMAACDSRSAVAVLAVLVCPPGATLGDADGPEALKRFKPVGLFVGPAGKCVAAGSPGQLQPWLQAAIAAADAAVDATDADGDTDLAKSSGAPPGLAIAVPSGRSSKGATIQDGGIKLLAAAVPCGTLANFHVLAAPLQTPVEGDVSSVQSAAAFGRQTTTATVDSVAAQVLPHHTSSVLPVLPMEGLMSRVDRQVLEAVAKGMAAREGPTRHACVALANRIALVKGTSLSDMLAPWSNSFATIVHQHSFRRLSPMQQVGQLHMMAYLARHVPSVMPVDERALVLLLDAINTSVGDAMERQLLQPSPTSFKGRRQAKGLGALDDIPEYDADPEAAHSLRVQVSPAPYLWPDPMELGWPHYGVRGDMRVQYARTYTPARALSHSHGAMGAPRAACVAAVGPTCTAECVHPETFARDEQLPSWCATLKRLTARARGSDVPDPTPSSAGIGLDCVMVSPNALATACGPDFGEMYPVSVSQPLLVAEGMPADAAGDPSGAPFLGRPGSMAAFEGDLLDGGLAGVYTRGVGCIHPGAVTSSIAPSAIHTPTTKYALTAAVTGTPTVEYTPPNIAVILRCAVAELIHAMVDANPVRMLREGAPAAEKRTKEDGTEETVTVPGANIGRLSPTWMATLRGRFYRVLLTSQFAAHPAVVASSHAAFSRIMSHPSFQRSLLRDMLQGPNGLLRTQLQMLSTERPKFSTATLRGIGAMFTLLSDYFNETLADTVLDHLRKWRDPDSVQKQRIAPRGREVDVAALLFNLLHLLPCRKGTDGEHQAVPQQVISLWRDIADLLYRYRSYGPLSSPLLEPVARLLERFPQETLRFFLDPKAHHLAKPLVANMMVSLVQHPNSVSIRRLLASQWGATVVCQHLLRVRPKTRSMSQDASGMNTPQSSASPNVTPAPGSMPSLGDTPTAVTNAPPSAGGDDDDDATRRSGRKRRATQAALASAEQDDDGDSKLSPPGSSTALGSGPAPAVDTAPAAVPAASPAASATPAAASTAPESAQKLERAMERAAELQYQGLRLVRVLSKTHPRWLLTNNGEVVKQVLSMWRDTSRRQRLHSDDKNFVRNAHEVRLMAKILMTYLRVEPGDVDVYLHLLSAQAFEMHVDTTFVKDFLSREVPASVMPELRAAIIQRYVALHSDSSVEDRLKRDALHILVLPVLQKCLRDEQMAVTAMHKLRALQSGSHEEAAPESVPRRRRPAADVATPAVDTLEMASAADITARDIIPADSADASAAAGSPSRDAAAAGALTSPAPRTADRPLRNSPGQPARTSAAALTSSVLERSDWHLAVRASPLRSHIIQSITGGVKSGEMDADTAALLLRAREDSYPLSVDKDGEPAVRRVVEGKLAGTLVAALMGGDEAAVADDSAVSGSEVKGGEAPELVPASDAAGLQVEVLRLAALLISGVDGSIIAVEHRKVLIKYAWSLLKSKDTTVKQWACITACKYVAKHQTPPKIIMQVFVTLLRDQSATHVGLVREALRTITPALPARFNDTDMLMALKWVKRMLYDEINTPRNMTQVWRLLVQHERVFYARRSIYVPLILHALPRIALASSATVTHRELTVALIALLIKWDTRACQEGVNKAIQGAGGSGDDDDEAAADTQRTLTQATANTTGNLLLKLIVFAGQVSDTSDKSKNVVDQMHVVRRALRLLHALLQLWPDTALKAQYLVVRNNSSPNSAITFVPLISVLVQTLLTITQCPGSASNLIPSAAGFIMHLLTPTFAMSRQDDPSVPALHKLVRQLLSAIMDRFPLALPAARMRHVRFWPWLASCISFRLSTTVAHKLDDAREYAKTASEVAEPETQPLEQRLAASAAAAASGLAEQATPHRCIPGVLNVPTVDSPHVAQMNEQQRSTAYSDDDTQASSAWRQMRLWLAVNASEDNVLSLLRLLMLIAAKSPTVLDAYASCLLRLLSVLLSEHLGETRADEKPGKGGAGDPLPPLASDENKKERAVNISKRLESIVLLVKLLGSRALSLQPQKLQQFLDLLNRAIPKSTSARLLWECLPLLRMLLSGTPTATAGNTVGLTQKQKLSLVYSLTTLGVFAAADVRGVHSPVTQRAIQLGADYAALQRAYLLLALDLYRGRPSQDTTGVPVWWQHSLPGAKVPHGWARPTALLRQMLQSTLMAGTLAGDTSVRQQCMEVMVEAAQSKNDKATAEWLVQWAELSPLGAPLDPGARRQKRRLAEQWRELPGFMYTPCPIGQGCAASTPQQAPRTGAAVALATLLNSSWDQFASHVWIAVATRLLMRGMDAAAPLQVHTVDEVLPPVGALSDASAHIEAEEGDLGHAHAAWLAQLAEMKQQTAGDFISSLDCLSHLSLDVAVHMWRQLMPAAWRTLTPWQRRFVVPHLSVLLCKDVHHLQIPGAAADALDIVVSHATREGAWQGKHAVPEPRWYAPVWCGANGGAAGAGTGIAPGSIMAGGTRDRAFAAAYRAPADADMCGTGNAAMSSWGINVVQLLMFGIVACEPRPMFRPEVLRYVARTFGCWEMALPLLEEQAMAMSTPLPAADTKQLASKSSDGDIAGLMAAAKHLTRAMRVDGLAALEGSALPAHAKAASEIGPVFNLYDALLLPTWPDSEASTGPQQEARVRSLITLYSELGADDMAAGVRRRFSASPLSRIALTLESHGKWQMAYDVYAAAMQHAANDHNGKQEVPPISVELPAGALHGGAPIASSVTVVNDVESKRPAVSGGGAAQALLDAARAGTVAPLGDLEHVAAAPKRKGTKRGRGAAAEPAGRIRKKRGAPAASPAAAAAGDATEETLALLNGRPPRKTHVPSGMAALQALAGASLDPKLLGTEGFGKPWTAPDVQLARKRPREDDAIDTREALSVPRSAAEPVLTSVSAVELGMWEQRWVEACKQLTFWPVLKAYASATQDSALLADACSKLGEWESLHKLLASPQLQTAALYAERVKLYEVECAVMNFKLQSSTMQALEGTNNSAVSLILKRWMLLPSGMVAHKAHERLLADTQRLREVREAIAVAQAVENSISRAQRPDLKPVLGTWRERLPNVWEGLPVWDNILTWRHHVFNATVDRLTSFLLGDLSAEEGSDLHDATWTVIKVADTARKLDLPGVCALTLSRLMEVTSLDLHDAFAKARQQMIVALPAAKQGLYPGGKRAVLRGALSLLNCTDMGLFESDQRAELLRMKGMYWAELGPGLLAAPEGAPASTQPGPDCWSQANTELAAAVRVHNSLAKGWLTWGKFLQSVFDAAVFPHLSRETSKWDMPQVLASAKGVMAALPPVEGAPAQEAAAADGEQAKPMAAAAALPIAVQAIVALLFAVNHNCKDAPLQLARVLALLDNDTPAEVLSKALNKYGAQVPSWLWVAWVPQLLTLLSTPSAAAASAILSALVLNFPQAVYFQLATFKQQRSSMLNKARGHLVTKNPTTLQLVDGREVNVPAGTDARALKTLMRQRGASVTQDPHTEYRSTDFKVLPPPSLEQQADGAATEEAAGAEASPAASPTASASPSASPSDDKARKEEEEGASGRHAEALMKQLISKHGHVETLLYYFSDAVTSRLTSPGATARASEEELLGLVDNIANRTLHAVAPGSNAVPPRSADGLQRAFAQVFAPPTAGDAGKRSSAKFKEQYRLAFARDLVPNLDQELSEALGVQWAPAEGDSTVPNPNFCSSLLEFLERLASWRQRLRAVLVRSWQHLLFQYSSFLADLHHSQLEVPGQYTDGSVLASAPPPKVRVLGIDPYVAVGTSPLHSIAQRTMTVLGDDGRPYPFHVQAVAHIVTQSDARTAQQATLLNRVLASHHDSRSRQLSLTEPAVVPVSSSARLLAAEPGNTSIGAVADAWLARNGHAKDAPLQLFMARARAYIEAEQQGQPAEWQPTREVKLAAVQSALQQVRASGLVHATALRQHVANSSTCPDVQAQIRARFSRQYGTTALLSWAVNAHARSSHRLQISMASGNATLLDTRPSFHPENGLLNPRDSVPFRMTPQLQCFLTPIAIDGAFANSFTAAATALMGEADWFRSHSTLYQRDELLAWRCRGKVLSDKRTRELVSSMRGAWLRNVRGAVDRITNMLPPEKVDLNKVPREWFDIKMHVKQIEEARSAPKAARPSAGAAPPKDIIRSLCDGQVYELLAAATNENLIAVMALPWAPWL